MGETTTKKLRIAIFHLGFFFSGGGEKLVIEEAMGLKGRGHEVDIFAPVLDPKRCFPDLIRKVGIKKLFPSPSFNFPLRDFISITSSVFLTPFSFWRFRNYDIFFGANQPGPLICWILSRMLNKPYVIYLAQPTRIIYPRKIDLEEGFGKGSFNLFYLFTKIFYPIIKKLDEISIKNAKIILANGDYIAEVLSNKYHIRPISCPAGCYLTRRSALAFSRFTGGVKLNFKIIKKPYILLTNRHFPQKRFDYIITSLPFILKKIPSATLVITGTQTFYTHYLKMVAGQLGIEDKIFFLGLVKETQLTELYKNAAVYVYTAPEEDFGMGVIEAMGAGCPVVAWRNGGPSTTVIHGETGFLAEPFDVSDFANCVIRLLKDQNLNREFGRKAWERAFDFSYKIHVDKLEKAFLASI